MLEFQEPKYDTRRGRIVNRETGKPIPGDEPIFIMRAQDPNAIVAMDYYMQLCKKATHKRQIKARVKQFAKFANDNPDRMKKEPD